eukprot:sb/3463203/
MEVGEFVKVHTEYNSHNSGDLSLFENDVVKVTDVLGDGWYEGDIGGTKGLFPDSCCTKLNFTNRSQPYVVALFDHDAHLDDELSFQAGDQIFLTKQINTEWFEGMCRSLIGMFPASFVDVVNAIPPTPPPEEHEKIEPRRPPPLDYNSLERLRTKSFSLRKSASPEPSITRSKTISSVTPPPQRTRTPSSNKSSPSPLPPARPPVFMPTVDPPPPPLVVERGAPTRPPSFTAPPRPPPSTDAPARPAPLKTETLVKLREKKKSGERSPKRPPSTYVMAPPNVNLSTLPPDQDELQTLPSTSSGGSLGEEADPTPHISAPLSRDQIDQLYGNRKTFIEQGGESGREEVEYANEEDIIAITKVGIRNRPKQPIRTLYLGHMTGYQPIRDQSFLICCILDGKPIIRRLSSKYLCSFEIDSTPLFPTLQEYKTTAQEDAEMEKIEKSIATKEGVLRAEVESKRETEDLLGKQFSGKKINSENVEVLRSLLQAHNEKIVETQTAIDKLKAKLRNCKSPRKEVGETRWDREKGHGGPRVDRNGRELCSQPSTPYQGICNTTQKYQGFYKILPVISDLQYVILSDPDLLGIGIPRGSGKSGSKFFFL